MLKKGSFATLFLLMAALAVFVSGCNDSKDNTVWLPPTANLTPLSPEQPTALLGKYKITRVQAYYPDNATEPLFDTADASYMAVPNGYFSVGANRIAIDMDNATTSVDVVYAAKFDVSFDKLSPVKDTAQQKFAGSYIDAKVALPPLPNVSGGMVPDIALALNNALAALNGTIDYDNQTLTLVISPTDVPVSTTFGELSYTSDLYSYKVILTMQKTEDGSAGVNPNGYPSAPTAIDFNNPESVKGTYVISSFAAGMDIGGMILGADSSKKDSVQYINGELVIDSDASGFKISSKIGMESLFLIGMQQSHRLYQYTNYPVISSVPVGDQLVYAVNPPRPSGETGQDGDIDNATITKANNSTLNIELGTFQDFQGGVIIPAVVRLTVTKISDTPAVLEDVPYWTNTAINPSVISTFEGHYFMDNMTFATSNSSATSSLGVSGTPNGLGEVSAALNDNGELVIGIKYQQSTTSGLPAKLAVINKAGIVKPIGSGSFEYLGADNMTKLTLTDADLPGILISGETLTVGLFKTSDKTVTVGNGDLYK